MSQGLSIYEQINNQISKIGRAADKSINNNTLITTKQLSVLLTNAIEWCYDGKSSKGIDAVVNLWNNNHKSLIFGRHRYIQRIIEPDTNTFGNFLWNAQWYLNGIFINNKGIDLICSGNYKAIFIKDDNNKYKASKITFELDYFGPKNKSLTDIMPNASKLKLSTQNNNEIEQKTIDKSVTKCGNCGKDNALKRCASCKVIYYCTKECQAMHWKNGHKKICKGKEKKNKPEKKKKKKKRNAAQEEFIKMMSAFSNLPTNDNDEKEVIIDENKLREEYSKMIDRNKLKNKYMTYYSFKLLGYNDNDIPPYSGNVYIGEQPVTMNEMINNMIQTKRALIRDPDLKNELHNEIMKYKQSK
eukprot:543010_1